MQNRIAGLLAKGLKPSQVATIVGVSPARISQIAATPEFQLVLLDKTEEVAKGDIEELNLSAKYTAAEHSLIARVTALSETAELKDITSALRVVAERQENMKARVSPVAATQQPLAASLTLPTQMIANIYLGRTTQGEIVSVGDMPIAPMPASAVGNLFNSMKEIRRLNHEPSPSNTETEECALSLTIC